MRFNQDRPLYSLVLGPKRLGIEIGVPPKLRSYRDPILDMLPNQTLVAVEIGTLQGWFAYRIMKQTQIEKLYCVDSWARRGDMGDGKYNRRCFLRNLKSWVEDNRCIPLSMTSKMAAASFRRIESRPIDWLFVDGDHSAQGVWCDLVAWVPMVRSGGLVSGHDWTGGSSTGVKLSVTRYVKKRAPGVTISHGFVYDFTGNGRSAECWWWVKP